MNAIDRERLTDMLEYAREAVSMLGSRKIQAAEEVNRETLLALTYSIQVIGEAASNVSSATRAILPTVPWPKVVGMRHRLVHGYRNLSTETIVATVRDDLPGLITILEGALRSANT